MAVLAIRLADSLQRREQGCTAKSRAKCGTISGRSVPADEVPIKHVTNGIHVRTWLAPDIQFVLERYLSDKWMSDPTDQSVWEAVKQIPDEELWRAHERGRERLVSWGRGRCASSSARAAHATTISRLPNRCSTLRR
jgi:starch phosphorylase